MKLEGPGSDAPAGAVDAVAPLPLFIEAERLSPSLTVREWVVGSPRRNARHHLVLLHAGRGRVVLDETVVDLDGPCIAWLPAGWSRRIRIEAGAGGHLLSVAEEVVARAVGSGPDAAALRQVADRVILVPAGSSERYLGDLAGGCDSIARELADGAPGSLEAVAAHVGLALIWIWRLSGIEAGIPGVRRTTTALLGRFRHLLDLHFREQWSVAQYARALGISPDRLHSACLQGAGRPPQVLIHERLVAEARRRLELSALPVAQIGYSLGFRDPAYFSRFFRRLAGMAPGAYRRLAAERRPKRDTSYAAWP